MDMAEYDDIYVALATTAFTIKSNLGKEADQTMRELNIPVCSTKMKTPLFDRKSFLQRTFMMADAKNMAQTVRIDSTARSVYVGYHSLKLDDALVEYVQKDGGRPSKAFFERWNVIQTMMFEFDVVNLRGENLFCIRGLWVLDKWKYLDVAQRANLEIVDGKTLRSLMKNNKINEYESNN
jgi:hypothetical protein